MTTLLFMVGCSPVYAATPPATGASAGKAAARPKHASKVAPDLPGAIPAAVSSGVALETGPEVVVSQEVMVQREKRRLEELIIWKLSEELKLPVETEKPFAEAIRSLNREKAHANLDVAAALMAIEKSQEGDRTKSKAAVAKAVASYEKAWRTYGTLPLREVSRMRAILGSERLGQYLVAKSQMAEKLKALAGREALESESETATPAPKAK